jgi:carbon-monoxide dehydrogenase medium subunit
VKPAPFRYVRPSSVAEAVDELEAEGGMARVLAGGQSLVPMLHMRLMRPSAVIDINGLGDELGRIEANGSDTTIGALVRYAEIESSAVVDERLPLLRNVVRYIGDRQVRNRGTLGGSIAQSDPTGEMPLACVALHAEIVVRSAQGERTIPAAEFFDGSYANVLEPEEMIVAARFPMAPEHCSFFELGRKHNDFCVLSVAALGTRDSNGRWTDVRLALGGLNDQPMLATAAADRLEGRVWDAGVIAEAVQLAMDVVDPPDDVRASAEYRRAIAPVHVRRILEEMADG